MTDQAFTHHTFRHGGVDLHYVTGGGGPAAVLLHGWPQTWLEWRRAMPLLAARYTVIAPDLRGMGDSSKPEAGYDLATLAGDVRSLLSSLGVDKARVVGHDLGGPVAYALAALHPGLVERLAVVEAPLPGVSVPGLAEETERYWHMGFHQAPDVPEALIAGRERMYLTWFFKTFAYDKAAVGPEEIDEYVRCYSAPGGLRAGLAYYRHLPVWAGQVAEWARTKLTTPVLALGGEMVLGDLPLRLMREVASDVRGGVVPNCGHWVAEERPDYLADQLLEFFGG